MIFLFSTSINAQKDFKKSWNDIYRLEAENLPKSALRLVDQIYKEAQKQNNTSQLIKSLLYKSKFSLTLEENAQLKIINQFKENIKSSSFPTKNILENILANLYWQYFNQNRWKFYNRTQTKIKVNKNDFRTWDLTTLFSEIRWYFQSSLKNSNKLQNININDFSDILQMTKDTKSLQPTLFDFLAYNSLDFYKTSETTISKPTYEFKINSKQYLDNYLDFSKMTLKSVDSLSLQFNSLKIYQKLIQLHLKRNNLLALVNYDIERLSFVNKHAIYDNKKELLIKTLKSSKEIFKNKKVMGLYAYEIAKIYNELAKTYKPTKDTSNQFKNKKALNICSEVIEKFPESLGAKKCGFLKSNIENKKLNITSEKHIPVLKYSKVLVKYKNISDLSFSIHKITSKENDQLKKIYNSQKQYSFIKKLSKVKEWKSTLKSVNDYQEHTIEIGVPKLKSGNYIILAIPEQSFNKNATFAYTNIQVTDIAIVLNQLKEYNYQIVNRNNGAAIVNAKVNLSNQTRKHYNASIDKNFVTDKNGEFTFNATDQYYPNVTATINYKNDQAIFSGVNINPKYENYNNTNRPNIKTFLFTDRSIYKPSQTIYFKGILLESNKNNAKIKSNEIVSIHLKDPNYQTLKELKIKTNEFGSFSSNFIIPSSGLTGQFIIESSFEDRKTSTYVTVEEYKRPKFKAEFKPITETIKVNDNITIKGFSESFSGPPISGAKVVYRVHRKIIYPRWWYSYKPFLNSSPKEITQGKTITDESGNFSINFNASPDNSVNKEILPIFTYEVTADVTDINGETRSAIYEVKAGYHALVADIEIPSNINKLDNETKLIISTKNLNDENVENTGLIEIYKLKSPNRILRKRPWKAPDFQEIPEAEFKCKYPNEAYTNEDNFLNWKKSTKVFSSDFNTAIKSELIVKGIKRWTSGKYLVTLNTKDKFGQTVKAKQYFTVFSTKDKLPFDQQLISVSTDKKEYKIGDTAVINVSSNASDISLVLLIEKKHKVFSKHRIHLNKGQKKILIPVNKSDLGGFGVKWYFVNHNTFEKGNINILVPYPKTDLEIITNTFRNKLQPGKKETWSFTIQGNKKEKVVAELLAGMYDASLDAFKPHQWNFSPIQKPIYRSFNNVSAGISFGNTSFNVVNQNKEIPINYKPLYTKYNWFGLSLNSQQWAQKEYVRNIRFQKSNFEKQLSGVVKDKSGPLSGVSVLIKGTNYGTKTDFQGKFTLNANKDDIVLFDFTGMEPFEKQVTDFSEMIVTLKASENPIETTPSNYGIKRAPVRKMARMSESMAIQDNMETEPEIELDVESGSKQQNTIKLKNNFNTIETRTNLRETAFFYPHLITDSTGKVSFSFTVPEALTNWKLQLLTHNKELSSSIKTLETITQKELMINPNAPRFLRHGDKIKISAKISNLSEKKLDGIAKLILTDPVSGKEIDIIKDSAQEKSFLVNKNENTEISWNLYIPETANTIQYKILAKADNFSDGEQNILPVLSNRILVTESLPMWVRSKESKTFNLNKLKNYTSASLKNHQLTLEVTSNPAWYAVQALPYLMESSNESSEQLFSRYYANILASYIANSNPKIQHVFNQWKSSDALISNLEKNQELKSLVIQETPWLRDALSETEQKKRIALLFDLNKQQSEQKLALRKLNNMQFNNGGFPWFKGSYHPNTNITLHIASGFGHLKKLGISNFDNMTNDIIQKSIVFLDKKIVSIHNELIEKALKIKEKDGEKEYKKYLLKNHLNNFILHYIYMRSFYNDLDINSETKKAISFYTKQASEFWKKTDLYSQGLMAIINYRYNKKEIANKILKSLKEQSISSDEMGMYWKSNKSGWGWYQAPIETQALLIEAFSEIENDTKTIDNLKIWLLKNKQINRWETTKATTEAIYSLLLQGSQWLPSTEMVYVKIGNKIINPKEKPEIKLEAGSGYYKTSWKAEAIKKDMGSITLSSKGNTVAWGGLYWQYFENLNKITKAKTPLELTKKVFKKINTNEGKQLIEITKNTIIKVGDLLTVRIELYSDRDMQFIHMKDMRASGVEPVSVLSEYKWQDGLGYYQSTKNASTDFFFSNLPKGSYVFEYDIRANNAGEFSNGITSIQNMYAPEYTSHSNGSTISIKK